GGGGGGKGGGFCSVRGLLSSLSAVGSRMETVRPQAQLPPGGSCWVFGLGYVRALQEGGGFRERILTPSPPLGVLNRDYHDPHRFRGPSIGEGPSFNLQGSACNYLIHVLSVGLDTIHITFCYERQLARRQAVTKLGEKRRVLKVPDDFHLIGVACGFHDDGIALARVPEGPHDLDPDRQTCGKDKDGAPDS